MRYEIRMLSAHRRRLGELLEDTSAEQACFLLCSFTQASGKMVLLVREIAAFEPGDFALQGPDILSILPPALLRIGRRAQRLGYSVYMVHTHPMCPGEVTFSRADDIGDADTFRFFRQLLPSGVHGSIVFNRTLSAFDGRVHTAIGKPSLIDAITVVDGPTRFQLCKEWTSPSSVEASTIYDRQIRLLSAAGQRSLSTCRVGVVGCGGIGSIVSMLLAHSGIGHLLLIDFDQVETTNLPRIVGATADDVKRRKNKVEIAKRYVEAISPGTIVTVFSGAVESEDLVPMLKELDIIVCATDSTLSRAYLNQFGHQYLIPVLDTGVQFSVDSIDGLLSEIGKVNLMLPGTPCLSCSGHLDPAQLHAEDVRTSGLAETNPYVLGSVGPEPSMMIFNAQIAARAVQYLVNWIAGTSQIDPTCYEQHAFFGLAGRPPVSKVRKRKVEGCPICDLQAGVVGCGDGTGMFVRHKDRPAA